MNQMKNIPNDLPAWMWIIFPPLMLLALIFADAFSPPLYQAILSRDEQGAGLAEIGTILVLLPGIVAGFLVFFRRQQLPDWRLGWWALMWALACIYFAGEEASWGQHFFGWEANDTFAEINRQKETNLHNTSSWLNEKPRLMVELWVIIGGLIIPIRRWLLKKQPAAGSFAFWFWPTHIVMPTAFIFFLMRCGRWIKKLIEVDLSGWLTESEISEYYIAVFLSLYLLSLWRRMSHHAHQKVDQGNYITN
jgi:hypothetical protein